MLVPYELRPSAPPEGISAKEHGIAHSEHVAAYIAKVAAEEGIDLHDGDLQPNTHLARPVHVRCSSFLWRSGASREAVQ